MKELNDAKFMVWVVHDSDIQRHAFCYIIDSINRRVHVRFVRITMSTLNVIQRHVYVHVERKRVFFIFRIASLF